MELICPICRGCPFSSIKARPPDFWTLPRIPWLLSGLHARRSSVREPFGPWCCLSGGRLIARLNSVADEKQVSASALRWRLVGLGEIDQATGQEISEATLHMNGRAARTDVPPALFSGRFMEVVALALEQGCFSVERAVDLLDVSPDGLAALFATYDVECPKNLKGR